MSLIRRVAFLSLHTSPMEQPGSGDAGGMNVYIRALAAALAETGVEVEIFTRSTSASSPPSNIPPPASASITSWPDRRTRFPRRSCRPAAQHGGRDRADPPAPAAWPVRRHPLALLGFRRGRAGALGLWGVPLVHTMHTMAKVKNLLLDSGEQPEPRRREVGEHRIVDGAARLIANTPHRGPELVSHYGADNDNIDVAPPGVDLATFTPAFRSRARAERVPAGPLPSAVRRRIQRLKGPQILIKAAARCVPGARTSTCG